MKRNTGIPVKALMAKETWLQATITSAFQCMLSALKMYLFFIKNNGLFHLSTIAINRHHYCKNYSTFVGSLKGFYF